VFRGAIGKPEAFRTGSGKAAKGDMRKATRERPHANAWWY